MSRIVSSDNPESIDNVVATNVLERRDRPTVRGATQRGGDNTRVHVYLLTSQLHNRHDNV